MSMLMCDGDKAGVCVAENANSSTTAKQFACTWAMRVENEGASLAGLIRRPRGNRVSVLSRG